MRDSNKTKPNELARNSYFNRYFNHFNRYFNQPAISTISTKLLFQPLLQPTCYFNHFN